MLNNQIAFFPEEDDVPACNVHVDNLLLSFINLAEKQTIHLFIYRQKSIFWRVLNERSQQKKVVITLERKIAKLSLEASEERGEGAAMVKIDQLSP